jgi:signal transduction histidine kinase
MAGFMMFVLGIVVQGLVSVGLLYSVSDATKLIAKEKLPNIQTTSLLSELVNEIRRSESKHILSSTRKEMRDLENKMVVAQEKLIKLDAQVQKMLLTDTDRKAFDNYKENRTAWLAANAELAPLSRAGKQDDATVLYNGDSAQSFEAMMEALSMLSDQKAKEASAAWDGAQTTQSGAEITTIVIIIAGVAMAFFISTRIAKSIANPIEMAANFSGAISSGDLGSKIIAEGSDETAKLLQSLEKMRADIKERIDREASMQEKANFLAKMSHEMRTPLNGILGFAELLKDEMSDSVAVDWIEKVYESGLELHEIVESISQLFDLDLGTLSIQKTESEVKQVVSQAFERCSQHAELKGIEFQLTIDESAPHKAIFDPDRVTSVLYRLISNAVKYTDVGSVRVNAARRDDALVISVVDTGIGIDERHHARIFDRFYQADDFDSRTKGGMGLGLALAREVCVLMDAKITVASTKGQGSTFELVLPLGAA